MDINTTSVLYQLSTVSIWLKVVNTNGFWLHPEVGSLGLNPQTKRKLFELFSDGAVPLFLKQQRKIKGTRCQCNVPAPEGAHDTGTCGGLTAYHPKLYSEATKTDYMFDMKGKKILYFCSALFQQMFQEFQEKRAFLKDAVDYIIPRQFSAGPCHLSWTNCWVLSKDKYSSISSWLWKYGFS